MIIYDASHDEAMAVLRSSRAFRLCGLPNLFTIVLYLNTCIVLLVGWTIQKHYCLAVTLVSVMGLWCIYAFILLLLLTRVLFYMFFYAFLGEAFVEN